MNAAMSYGGGVQTRAMVRFIDLTQPSLFGEDCESGYCGN